MARCERTRPRRSQNGDADLRSQQVSVSIDLRDRLPPLLGNRAQLEEVLLNLITNAIEAMDALTDRARLLQIRSYIIQEGSAVVVTIEDSGTGIHDKNKARIFEPSSPQNPREWDWASASVERSSNYIMGIFMHLPTILTGRFFPSFCRRAASWT